MRNLRFRALQIKFENFMTKERNHLRQAFIDNKLFLLILRPTKSFGRYKVLDASSYFGLKHKMLSSIEKAVAEVILIKLFEVDNKTFWIKNNFPICEFEEIHFTLS